MTPRRYASWIACTLKLPQARTRRGPCARPNLQCSTRAVARVPLTTGLPSSCLRDRCRSLLNNCEDVVFLDDQIFFTLEFYFRPGVLAEENFVASLDHQRRSLAGFEQLAIANCHDFTLLRLLFGRVGDDDAANFLFLLNAAE